MKDNYIIALHILVLFTVCLLRRIKNYSIAINKIQNNRDSTVKRHVSTLRLVQNILLEILLQDLDVTPSLN